jgi:ATP-dependent helicase/nuclease subunit A
VAQQYPIQAAQPLQAALGEAMHRTLEWHRPGQPLDTQPLRHNLATQYRLTEEQVDMVLQRAQAILHGGGAWAWDAAQIDWQANEVDIAWQGRTLRIDRLVRQKMPGDAPSTWWVLDFKSALDPDAQETLRSQLADYREAVKRLHPQETVRAAFLTAQGKLVEPQ